MSEEPIVRLRMLADAAPPAEVRARLLARPGPQPHAARTVATVLVCNAAVACGAALVVFALRPARPLPLMAEAVLRGEVRTADCVHQIEPAADASVVVEEDGPACTRVRVEEGQVHTWAPGLDRFVSAGERAEYCASSAPSDEARVREALSALSAGGDAANAEVLLLRYLAAQPAGDLEEEARFRLFAIAAAARAPVAAERAAALLARFPDCDRAAWVRAWLAAKAP